MKALIAFFVGACVFAAAATAVANHRDATDDYDWQARLEQRFTKIDANKDGKISKEEFLAYEKTAAEKAWESYAAAAGDDGVLSLEEAKAFHAAKMEKRKAEMKERSGR